MTRIGLVVHGQPPELVGGTERLVSELGAALAARGDTVEIFSGSIEWRPEFEVVRDESGPVPIVRVHRHDLFFERWDKLENPFVERAYGTWLDTFAPDLVHVHHWARLTTRLVAVGRARGLPVVLSLHDLLSTCPRYHRVKQDLSFCDVPAGPEVCRNCAPRWRFQSDSEVDGSVTVFAADLRAEVAGADALVAPTEGHAQRVLQWLDLDRPVTARTRRAPRASTASASRTALSTPPESATTTLPQRRSRRITASFLACSRSDTSFALFKISPFSALRRVVVGGFDKILAAARFPGFCGVMNR